MQIRGIIQSAALEENPPGSDTIELVVWVQGVGRGQPRRLIVPYTLLLDDPTLDPDSIVGHGFEAEAEPDPTDPRRWLIARITFASSRVLREPEV